MKVRALTAFNYDRRELKPGDVFDTKTDLHAQIFVEARKVEYCGSEKEEAARLYKTTSYRPVNEEAADDAEAESADRKKTPRRGRPPGKKVGAITSRRSGLVHRYRRTDLEAEDS